VIDKLKELFEEEKDMDEREFNEIVEQAISEESDLKIRGKNVKMC